MMRPLLIENWTVNSRLTMSFRIDKARPEDVPQIAHLHVEAFASNALMQAIYPTPEIWKELEKATEVKILADMKHPSISVLVAQEDGRKVVGYAVWTHPLQSNEHQTPLPAWELPEGTNWDVLRPWKEAAAKAADVVVGDMPHYGTFGKPNIQAWIIQQWESELTLP
jgi:hypothetical protein